MPLFVHENVHQFGVFEFLVFRQNPVLEQDTHADDDMESFLLTDGKGEDAILPRTRNTEIDDTTVFSSSGPELHPACDVSADRVSPRSHSYSKTH